MAKKAAKVSSKSTAKKSSPTKPAPGKQDVADWRATMLAEVRRLIVIADPEMVEERKWIKPTNPAGVPTWSHAGIVCTGETYKEVVKITFARGASLKDPAKLFNASLEGNARRAIDIRAGEKLNAAAFQALIRAAVEENLKSKGEKSPPVKTAARSVKKSLSATSEPSSKATSRSPKQAKPVKLLSGGNPQIAKAEGEAPVQAYLAAISGWKRDLGQRLHALIKKAVPNVTMAVKWNSPFYGVPGQGWFLSYHVFTRYIKVTFFKATSLDPVPPGGTSKEARWFDIHEQDELDEAQLTSWLKQAAAIPGWMA